jgi:Flp pilus assembly protein TadG
MIQSGSYLGDCAKCLCSARVSQKHARHRGIALIWTTIFLLLIILLLGLSLDTGRVALVLHQMQNGSDAASLAGANVVKKDRNLARRRARDIAQQNFADGTAMLLDLNEENNPNGDIVIGWYNRGEQTFTPSGESDAVNSMAVITVRSLARSELEGPVGEMGGPVALNFGSLAGVDTVDMIGIWQAKRRPYAIAMCAGGTGAGLIALSETGRGVYLNGTVTLDVTPIYPAEPGDGEIQVNSVDDEAFFVDGGPTIEASALNVTGGIEVGNYDLTVPYNTPAPPIPDPLAWLEEPTWNVADDLSFTSAILKMDSDGTTKNGIYVSKRNIDAVGNPIPWELYPGYYSEGFIINCGGGTEANPIVHFNPGVYIIGGSEGLGNNRPSGMVLDAQSYITSTEATFFITHYAAGNDYGVVDIAAGAGFKATEPTSGYYEGVTFFQDRDNTNIVRIGGGGNLDLDGTLYFPNALVYLRGGGDGFGNQLIGWRFDIGGNGDIGINYDGRNRAPVTTAFLVE